MTEKTKTPYAFEASRFYRGGFFNFSRRLPGTPGLQGGGQQRQQCHAFLQALPLAALEDGGL